LLAYLPDVEVGAVLKQSCLGKGDETQRQQLKPTFGVQRTKDQLGLSLDIVISQEKNQPAKLLLPQTNGASIEAFLDDEGDLPICSNRSRLCASQ